MSTTPTEIVFQHEPLPDRNWIRLVTIHPNLVDGNIACTLHLFDSTSRPEYVALSYLWGDPAPKHTIHINGMIRKIHENLWQFLRWARWKNATEYFWIDSLCLDQENHSELNEQVQSMGNIYHQAHHVLSWLARNPLDIEALQTVVDFGQGSLLLRHENHDRVRKALSQLVSKTAYWSRVWVFQEVICAKDCSVVCGPVEVDFEDLTRYLFTANLMIQSYDKSQLRELRREGIYKLASLRTYLKDGKRLSFTWLVTMLSGCNSTREVDRIYGLLGLASRFDPDFDSQALEVDYEKPLHQVYWDVACSCIETVIGPKDLGESGSYGYHGFLEFLGSMPVMQDGKSTWTERVTCVGAHLEAYSTAAATPENCRKQARVAVKIYQAVTSTWGIYADGVVISSTWRPAALRALRQEIELYLPIAKIGADIFFTSWLRARLYQSQGIMLGLSLIASSCAAGCLDEDITRRPQSGPPGWLCVAHMPQPEVSEAPHLISFTTAWLPQMDCAANSPSEACSQSAMYFKVAGEGIVVEIKQAASTPEASGTRVRSTGD